MSSYLDVDMDMETRGGFGQQPVVPAKPAPRGPRRPRTVLVLHVVFKYSMDRAKNDVVRIQRAMASLKRKPVLHGDRQLGWVIETSLTAEQLLGQVREALTVDCIENAWVFTPGADIASVMPLDPLTDRIVEAWASVREWNRTTAKAPPEMFAVSRRMADGRGEVASRILDDHPLLSPEKAAYRRVVGRRT